KISLEIEASANSSSAGPGQELSLAPGTSVRFVLTFDGAERGTVILNSADGEVQKRPLSDSGFHQEITLPTTSAFSRAEVRDLHSAMMALTKLVWLRTR